MLEFGTGALNIDGCRVGTGGYDTQGGTRPRDGRRGEYRTGTNSGPHVLANTGRWPANIVLTHSAACEPVGTRRVKASDPRRKDGTVNGKITGATVYEGGAGCDGMNKPFYADADGMETVQAWDCAPDCPVGELDRQSGVSKSTGGFAPGSTGILGKNDYSHRASPDRERGTLGFGDTGGASRFYPVFRYQAKAPASERPRLDDGTAQTRPSSPSASSPGWSGSSPRRVAPCSTCSPVPARSARRASSRASAASWSSRTRSPPS